MSEKVSRADFKNFHKMELLRLVYDLIRQGNIVIHDKGLPDLKNEQEANLIKLIPQNLTATALNVLVEHAEDMKKAWSEFEAEYGKGVAHYLGTKGKIKKQEMSKFVYEYCVDDSLVDELSDDETLPKVRSKKRAPNLIIQFPESYSSDFLVRIIVGVMFQYQNKKIADTIHKKFIKTFSEQIAEAKKWAKEHPVPDTESEDEESEQSESEEKSPKKKKESKRKSSKTKKESKRKSKKSLLDSDDEEEEEPSKEKKKKSSSKKKSSPKKDKKKKSSHKKSKTPSTDFDFSSDSDEAEEKEKPSKHKQSSAFINEKETSSMKRKEGESSDDEESDDSKKRKSKAPLDGFTKKQKAAMKDALISIFEN